MSQDSDTLAMAVRHPVNSVEDKTSTSLKGRLMTVADPTPTTPAADTPVTLADATPITPTAPAAAQNYPQPPAGTYPPAHAPYGGPTGYAQPGYPAPVYAPRTNGLAVASLVLAIVGFNIIAVVLGHVALKQIKTNGDGGKGFALAGLVIGYITLAIIVVAVLIGGSVALFGAMGGFGA